MSNVIKINQIKTKSQVVYETSVEIREMVEVALNDGKGICFDAIESMISCTLDEFAEQIKHIYKERGFRMNEVREKNLFWEVVRAIEGVADVTVTNEHEVVVEIGMILSNDMSFNYKLDTGTVGLYEGERAIIEFGEQDHVLTAFTELLEQVKYMREERQ